MSNQDNSSNTPALDVRAALKEGMAQLRAANVPSHTLATELLLMHALGRDRTWLYTHPEATLDIVDAEKYLALIARRADGEPTQYLTGKQEFWGLEFEVTPAVLIPRPETEHVIEVALERLGARGIKIDMRTGAPSPPLRIADVGTGSGCIAVALAHKLPHARIVTAYHIDSRPVPRLIDGQIVRAWIDAGVPYPRASMPKSACAPRRLRPDFWPAWSIRWSTSSGISPLWRPSPYC